jgi:hypothetical protein
MGEDSRVTWKAARSRFGFAVAVTSTWTPYFHDADAPKCLWAETFKGAKVEGIGHATLCHPDFAFASGYSSNLEFFRTKTLVQGDEVCNHCRIWRG